MTGYLKINKGIKLMVKVIPQSSKSEIIGFNDHYLRIKLVSPPLEGKANEECINLLSSFLKVPKSHFTILTGKTSKLKTIEVICDNSLVSNILDNFLKTNDR